MAGSDGFAVWGIFATFGSDGFAVWETVQVLGLLCLVLTIFPVLWIAGLDKGSRASSCATPILFVMFVFIAWMVGSYYVMSQPLYEARSRLVDSFELIQEATGLEATHEDNYSPIFLTFTDKPTSRAACDREKRSGEGEISFDAARLSPEAQEDLAEFLENDGFRVRRRALDGGGWSIKAVSHDQSYSFVQSSLNNPSNSIRSVVDRECGQALEPGGLESFVE